MNNVDETKKLFWILVGSAILGVILIGISMGFAIPAFNFTSYVSFVADGFIFITLGLFLFFTIAILAISNPISKIGTYHRLDSNSKYKKEITLNFWVVLKNNFILIIPLYFSIMFLINPTNYFVPNGTGSNGDVNTAFIVTLAVIPAYLLSLRLLTNPVQESFPIFRAISELIKNDYLSSISIENLKERFRSFFFSLTTSALFLMIVLYLYKSIPLNLNPFDVPNFILYSLGNSFYPSFDPDIETNLIRIFLYIVGFLLAIFVVTAFGEIIISRYKIFEEKEPRS